MSEERGFHHPLIRSMMEMYQGGNVFTIRPYGPEHVVLKTPQRGEFVVHRGWLNFWKMLEDRYGLTKADIEAMEAGYIRKRRMR